MAVVTAILGLLLCAATSMESRAVLHSFEQCDIAVAEAANSVNDAQSSLLSYFGSVGPNDSESLARGDKLGQTPLEQPGMAGSPPVRGGDGVGASGQRSPADFANAERRLLSTFQASLARQTVIASSRLGWEQQAYVLLLVCGNLTVLLFFAVSTLSLCYFTIVVRAQKRVDDARRMVIGAERNRAKFLSAAAHDLRQPLQAITLFLSTLLQQPLGADALAIGQRIEVTVASMRRMLTELLDVAKLDAGLVAADLKDVPLAGLFDSFRDEFDRLAEAAQLQLVFDPTAAVVQSDPALLDAILRNLLSNAIKYTRAGSVRLSATQQAKLVVIEVADTGIGIPVEKLEAVFQDFCRAGIGGADGLGLGLGIVRRLAALLGSSVSVRSTVGVGSVFSVTVPIGTAAPSRAELHFKPPMKPGNGRRLEVVLAEDNDGLRAALAEQLVEWGLDVMQAGSGKEALALLRDPDHGAVDVLVADFHLGDMTGLDLFKDAEVLTGRRPCGLIITASDDAVVTEALRTCPYRWLRKPLDLTALRAEIEVLGAVAAGQRHASGLIKTH